MTFNGDYGQMRALLAGRRDEYARGRYRDMNRDRLRQGRPLLGEFDGMTEDQRIIAGLYDGYEETRPESVSPAFWDAFLRDEAASRNHVPAPQEVARGYDIYGRPC